MVIQPPGLCAVFIVEVPFCLSSLGVEEVHRSTWREFKTYDDAFAYTSRMVVNPSWQNVSPEPRRECLR